MLQARAAEVQRVAYALWAYASLVLIASLGSPALSLGLDDPSSRHQEGLRSDAPSTYALIGARIQVDPTTVLEQGTLVIAEGKIVAVGTDVSIPASAQRIDASGLTIMAAPIDAYAPTAIASDTADNAKYWNAEVHPELKTVIGYRPDSAQEAAWRNQGFQARLFAPDAGIIRGQGALLTLGAGEVERRVLSAAPTQHALLTLSTRGNRDAYPNSPMGAYALARQAFYDAKWYAAATRAAEADSKLPRTEFNRSLAALAPVLERSVPLVVETSNEAFVLRADRFAREFEVSLIVVGNGEEYQRLDQIQQTARTLILPLDFPAPPDVATLERAADATLETLMHWDLAPENPARVAAAGIVFAFTGQGLEDPNKFWPGLRKAIDRGLQESDAIAALTTVPAAMFGVEQQVGTLTVGKMANFILASDLPWKENAKIHETWIAGTRYEVTPRTESTVAGNWRLRFSPRRRPALITLSGDNAGLNGEWQVPEPRAAAEAQAGEAAAAEAEKPDAPEAIKFRDVALRNHRLSALIPGKAFGQSGTLQLNLNFSPDDPETASGTLVDANGTRYQIEARRQRDASTGTSESSDNSASSENESATETSSEPTATDAAGDSESTTADAPEADPSNQALYEVNYPLGDFGRAGIPDRPSVVFFTNVTIWTCGDAGIITGGQVIVRDGVIKQVGSGLPVPEGALVIDGQGTMHLTPGIIDCHSHMGTDSGVNESGQAITAEVRIGDFIDADDITIYRQLAGGVTSANILHGSANPIGGQNQVIKLRWGATGEELKFAEAPAGIKFALGENVKQANWGERFTTRYPQTRMGVEQIMRDEFLAARQYRDRWIRWNERREGLPPRRDLELDAIVEILEGDRWIHCHSYRQDEILALLKTLDEFQIQIGSLQHILEGYKVAEALKRHGAMASAFSDWWAYKVEVQDAIPYAGAIMHNQGIVVSFNSDDAELARHLNQEAAKAVKYGGVSPEEALKFVTLNPAKQLRIDQYVGSIEPGKHADLVLWSGPPLSNLSRCEQTWIDGRRYFDREEDLADRARFNAMRTALIQRVLASGEKPAAGNARRRDTSRLWPRRDEYCILHDSSRCLDCISRSGHLQNAGRTEEELNGVGLIDALQFSSEQQEVQQE